MVDQQYTERENVSVALNPAARVVIDGVREDTGVPKTEALTRILEWFASLPTKLRLAVLNRDQETQRELVRAVLSDMAALQEASPGMAQAVPLTIEQATRVIHTMADHIERLSMGRSNTEAPTPTKKKPRR